MTPTIALALGTIGRESLGLGVFFLIGLLGGAHCLGMCGPLVTTYGTRLGSDTDRLRWRDVRQHALFNLGRTVSYAGMGAAMGALGIVLYEAANVVELAAIVRGTTGVLVGIVIVATGVRYLHSGSAVGFETLPGVSSLFGRVSGAVTDRLDSLVHGPGIVALGAVHAILPCPLLFPAYLYAFARGSPVEGALALGALGLGTFPTLFALGTLSVRLDTARRVTVHRILGVAFLGLGLVALTHGLRLLGAPVPHVPLPIYQPLS